MKKMIYLFAAFAVAAFGFAGSAEAAVGTCALKVSSAETVAVTTTKTPKGEIRTVVFATRLHCKNCVNKVNENIAFEKGVKDLKVDLEAQTITVKYDSSKTSVEKLAEAINRLGYPATVKK